MKNTERSKKFWEDLSNRGGGRVTVILEPEDMAKLDELRTGGEGRATALRRLALGPSTEVASRQGARAEGTPEAAH